MPCPLTTSVISAQDEKVALQAKAAADQAAAAEALTNLAAEKAAVAIELAEAAAGREAAEKQVTELAGKLAEPEVAEWNTECSLVSHCEPLFK